MQILNSLVPIFAVIGLGVLLRRRAFLSEDSTQAFNRFAYFFALPLFLFYKIGSAPLVGEATGQFTATLIVATVATGALGWLVATIIPIRFGSRGAFVQAAFRGNLAFMGLPLILFAIDELPQSEKIALESSVLIAISPVVVLYNVGSVLVLSIFNKKTEAGISWRLVARNIGFNPLLLACVAGVMMQVLGLSIPIAASRTCEVVGASAFPIALLGIGSQLASISLSGQWSDQLMMVVLKCMFCPLAGWFTASWLGLVGTELKVILILCAVPTAVSSYVLADQMEGDGNLAASSVVISTACSFLTLSVLLALTG